MAADAQAWADVAAGRVIDSDIVAHRFGGWHLARTDDGPSVTNDAGDCAPPDPPRVTLPAAPRRVAGLPSAAEGDAQNGTLMWTQAAVDECDRLRDSVASLGQKTEHRVTAALVGVMVRLIVDGPERRDGTFDVPLLPTLVLRVASRGGRMTVIGPRSIDTII